MPGQSSVAIVGQQVQRCRERLGLAATCQPSVEETSPVEADGRIIGWVAARSAERIHQLMPRGFLSSLSLMPRRIPTGPQADGKFCRSQSQSLVNSGNQPRRRTRRTLARPPSQHSAQSVSDRARAGANAVWANTLFF